MIAMELYLILISPCNTWLAQVNPSYFLLRIDSQHSTIWILITHTSHPTHRKQVVVSSTPVT